MKNFLERLRFNFIKYNPKYKKFSCKKNCLNCKYYQPCKLDFIGFIENGK